MAEFGRRSSVKQRSGSARDGMEPIRESSEERGTVPLFSAYSEQGDSHRRLSDRLFMRVCGLALLLAFVAGGCQKDAASNSDATAKEKSGPTTEKGADKKSPVVEHSAVAELLNDADHEKSVAGP